MNHKKTKFNYDQKLNNIRVSGYEKRKAIKVFFFILSDFFSSSFLSLSLEPELSFFISPRKSAGFNSGPIPIHTIHKYTFVT